ncbi:MAG: tRNA adenosine(34) deaminase TadA [Candidatus Improbicoccus pseudotrichonymphae]|uniref:tRNA-specific adenosine deaminase n=1 Tax=Candidatus Improbicoccus pseudotrichonymphae TaxID=3033792 RepID=A0AA48HV19_9FIRM|nr:MAG: tRNA adenosine(34) deaminase TadA [Candidatus Improbicoccus pseudotrichonymphae]
MCKIRFMKVAFGLAKIAYEFGEVPIGAVVVRKNRIIGAGLNLKETNKNPTHHAEILAISSACKRLSLWRLTECDIYTTLEPCTMCIGAIIDARISNLIYAASYSGKNNKLPLENLFGNHKIDITSGILKDECSKLISGFFNELRLKTN